MSHLENKGGECIINNLIAQPSLLQSLRLLFRLGPLTAHACNNGEETENDTRSVFETIVVVLSKFGIQFIVLCLIRYL